MGMRSYLAVPLFVLGACASPASGPDPDVDAPPVSQILDSQTGTPGVGAPRPQFFAQWKPDLPGLTRRPAVSIGTRPPAYPAAAMREGVSGDVTLEACIRADGKLADIHVVKSSGSAILDAATLDWARVVRFEPAEINGEPFAVCGYRFDHVWKVQE